MHANRNKNKRQQGANTGKLKYQVNIITKPNTSVTYFTSENRENKGCVCSLIPYI